MKKNNIPDLNALEKSFDIISKVLKKNDIIVLESTVYPGLTKKYERILQNKTKLISNKDFYICYSPERINPGDKKNNLKNIKKIVAFEGNNKEVKKNLYKVYKKLSKAIVFSKKIEEAETAKGIENIQRDLNIALFNEILLICKRLNLNFHEVIRLANSKWNFLKFHPGLVGGHCLPVDPYYLTFAAKKKGYLSKVTLSGRSVEKFCSSSIDSEAEIFNHFKNIYKNTRAYDPFLKNFETMPKNIEKYNLILFLSNGKKFKELAKKFDAQKLIDPFYFFSN